MAPTGQGGQWQDVLCCSLCGQKFEQSFPPISLICGHVICRKCARLSPSQKKPCPNDDWKPTISLQKYPTNVALLSIVMPNDNCMNFSDARTDEERSIDQSMLDIAKYFKRAESERGGSVYSQKLSRTLQRKVFSLICHQWIENEGRIKCIKACKTIAERVMTEMLLSIQSNTHVSSLLWSAVRARGCQFLGPAMQEDVLRLILMTLENGEKIARKNLVMYVVTTLMQDYPQVSKTCVGHVVQLLYRASCFNVIKREEASSLMQLKEDFRTYEALRREHDSQIVQIAFESGLRIGPDQWSALLYADQGHRSHMQSIIDKLQSPNSYSQCLDELNALLSPNNSTLTMQTRILINQMQPVLEAFSDVTAENPTSAELADYLKKLLLLLNLYTENEEMKKSGVTGTSGYNTETDRKFVPAKTTTSRFKTKMCANIESNRHCERGIYCSFAHSLEELRNHRNGGQPMTLGQPAPPPTVPQAINVQISPQMMMQNGSRMQYMARVPPPAPSQSYQFYAHHPHHHQQMRKAAPSTQQSHSHHSMPPPQPGQIMIYPRDERRPQEMIENGNSQIQQISQQMQQQQSSQQQQPMMIVQSPTHLPPPPPGSMVMIPPQQTPLVLTNQPPPVAIGTPSIPPPNTIWAAPSPTGPQGSMIFPGAATSPGQHPHAIWIQPTQASIFPIESYEFGLGGGMIWGAATTLRESGGDADQLLAKRYEILKRLEPPISIDDDDCEDGGIGHVSYTVASSVLDDSRMEGHHPMILGLTPVQGIDLPPIPVSFATVPTEETMTIIGDLVQQTGRPRASSLTQSAPMLTANGQVVQQHEQQVVGQDVTTVQSECGTMNVMDSLCQPIVTSVIHNSNSPTVVPIATVVTALPPPPVSEATKFVPNVPPPPPGQTMLVDSTTGLLTPMIRPIIVPHPQNVVSSSLDKIMDVKERMSEAQGNVSEAENAHLRMELRMAECEMAHLDPFTKNNCLLLELQQVDRELQQLQIDQPTRAQ